VKKALLKALLITIFFYSPLLAAPVYKLETTAVATRQGNLFTQGLFFHQGFLYESIGIYGQSAMLKWSLDNGTLTLLAKTKLPDSLFAEGSVAIGNDIYLLTWREGALLRLEAKTLSIKEAIFYQGEGWGLTYDGQKFWRSDGSNKLSPHKLDFSPDGDPLLVFDQKKPIKDLNELEWDPTSKLILANIWHKDLVAVINPISGQVECYLDFSSLKKKEKPFNHEAVLNGLALDEKNDLYLTGKYWTHLYKARWKWPLN
jgi:glutamine cyclotransferase